MSLAEYDDDDDGGDLLFLSLIVAGAYVALQFFRYRTAAAYGGGYFESTPPADSAGEGILNILVPLQLSPAGRDFIKQNEGYSATPYGDAGGQAIGYGHQIRAGDNIIPPITRDEAEALFAADAADAARAVSNGLAVQVSQSQFDSLVDLAYNIGADAFRRSTLLQLLNSGDFAGAAAQFSQWIHSGGAVNKTLVARRAADQNLFNGG